jgi:hypothetical protein
MFGETFEKHCRILTMSAYRGEWPVNRLAQGDDVTPQTSVQGLYLVGDAVKPSGYLMVEGVAQSVNSLFDLLDAFTEDETEGPSGVLHFRRQGIQPARPSRLNVLRWLWEAPGNASPFSRKRYSA